MRQARPFHFLFDALDVFLRCRLESMDADHHHVLVLELPPDFLVPRIIPGTVDSAKSHEVNDHYFPLPVTNLERRTVDPGRNVGELWGLLPARNPDRRPRTRILAVLVGGKHGCDNQDQKKTTYESCHFLILLLCRPHIGAGVREHSFRRG